MKAAGVQVDVPLLIVDELESLIGVAQGCQTHLIQGPHTTQFDVEWAGLLILCHNNPLILKTSNPSFVC